MTLLTSSLRWLTDIHTDTAFPLYSTSWVTNPILLINSLVSQLYEGLMMLC